MYGETVWRRAGRVKQLINNLDTGKYKLAMGYHLKFLLNAENGGTSTQSEASFTFQHPFHEKNLFSLASYSYRDNLLETLGTISALEECKKSPLLVDIHHSKKPLLVKLPRIVLIIHQI